MMDDIPDEFDVIIIGTGLTLSIVSGALARIGKRVLHLDDKHYYGGDHATFPLQDFLEMGQNGSDAPLGDDSDPPKVADSEVKLPDNKVSVPVSYRPIRFEDFVQEYYIPESVNKTELMANKFVESAIQKAVSSVAGGGSLESTNKTVEDVKTNIPETIESFLKQSRRYSIDLTPKLCFARGKLIKLLISANIGKYIEFKIAGETYIHMGGSIRQVPCSKQTLLLNKTVTPREKRQLMKFLTFCSQQGEQDETWTRNTTIVTSAETAEEGMDLPFGEYLKLKWKFSEETCRFIIYAIAGKTENDITGECIEPMKRYFTSIGVYGKTPFIYPLYGTAEISQAFCRLAAVFGAIFVLRQKVDKFIVEKQDDKPSKCSGIIMNGKYIGANKIVTTSGCLPENMAVNGSNSEKVSRAVLITDGTVLHGNTDAAIAITIPPNIAKNRKNVTVMCLSSDAAACPKNKWLVQLSATSDGSSTALEDLEGVVNMLTSTSDDVSNGTKKPRVLCASYFTTMLPAPVSEDDKAAIDNVVVEESSGVADLCFQASVTEAQRIFNKICPGEEFLPSAPEPEDVIWSEPEPDLSPIVSSMESIQSDVAVLKQRMSSIKDRLELIELRVSSNA